MIDKNTKIISTIGPATDSEEKIKELIENGANVIRFNMKHNTVEWHLQRIDLVNKIADDLKVTVGILIDLQGPEIRIETINGEPLEIQKDELLYITHDFKLVDTTKNKVIRVGHELVTSTLSIGDACSIDDGFVELEIIEKHEEYLVAKAIDSGTIKTRKGFNLQGKDVDLPSLISEDLDKLDIATQTKVDYIALSFVRSKKDVDILKYELDKRKIAAKIVAKVESQKGVDNIDEIIDSADVIMVARGDLGVEIPVERITFYQKEIINKCRLANKPVIVATQMLDSMIRNPRPTRAEVADVANAVFDGTDAVMLSGETASGAYPIRAINMMSRIVTFNETKTSFNKLAFDKFNQTQLIVISAMSMIKNATEMQIDKVIVFTETGYTAQVLSSFRPTTPIIALTNKKKVAESLALCYGVRPYEIDFPKGIFIVPEDIINDLKEQEIIKEGNTVLIIHGRKWRDPGKTNAIVLVTV